MDFSNENDSLAYFSILGELSSSLSLITVGFIKTFGFLSSSVGLFREPERHTLQHPDEDQISEENWFYGLNFKNIPYNGDSREIVDRVHVKHVLSRVTFMFKTVATFVQKVGLIWLESGFYLSYSGHKSNCWLEILNHWTTKTNVTTVLYAQRKKLNLV